MAELAVETVRLPLGAPVATAWGTLTERELVRVRLRFGPGDAGDGEAAPLEPYDGVPLAAVLAALDAYAAVLAGAGPDDDASELLEASGRSVRCRRPSRRSTSRCGTGRAVAPGGRWRRCWAATRPCRWRSTR